MKKTFLTLMAVLALTTSLHSYALGKLGHQLVCQLAFDHLSAKNQQNITDILKSVPAKTQQGINQYNYDDKNIPLTFANTCTWADAIKKDDSYDKFKPWHYANVARNETHINDQACQENCLPQAIIYHQQQLTKHKNTWGKAQALMFLGHWLGDIHQPLHISYADDWGGNKIKVQVNEQQTNGKCSSMHWYWDECIITNHQYDRAQWLVELSKQWQHVSIASWQPKQVWQWADESYQLVRQPSFNYCQLDNNNACLPLPSENDYVTLPQNYQKMYAPVIEQRMVLAAKRLANLLAASL